MPLSEQSFGAFNQQFGNDADKPASPNLSDVYIAIDTQIIYTCFVKGEWKAGGVPSGIIEMWSGAVVDIPNGYLLCDGNNGTPDLRNRFVVGAGDSYSVGETGGNDVGKFTAPSAPRGTLAQLSTANYNSIEIGKGGSSISYQTLSSASDSGDATPLENRPPYYALCYIMKE